MIFVLLAAVFAGGGLAGSPSTHVSQSVDKGLCPFPLAITVKSREESYQDATTALRFKFIGPSTITLRNASTGRAVILNASGLNSVDTTTGSVTFRGRQVWFWSAGKHVPFVSTDGKGSLAAPYFVLSGDSRARVIDPCALLAASPPSTQPLTTPAPWGLPARALGQIDHAGLIPLLGTLLRHDHVHLDVIVDGHNVPIPAGVGLAEPVDNGPGACPGTGSSGDCAPGHFFTAQVANSPLHTHAASGLIHIESDRPVAFTLGQFFDEWGVRFDSTCVGGHCAGGGKELRVFVNGKRVSGDPRKIVLGNHQEIAVVFGGPGEFGSVPSTYTGGWPGRGCGGAGERSCLP